MSMLPKISEDTVSNSIYDARTPILQGFLQLDGTKWVSRGHSGQSFTLADEGLVSLTKETSPQAGNKTRYIQKPTRDIISTEPKR
jgi:hypothetical protein